MTMELKQQIITVYNPYVTQIGIPICAQQPDDLLQCRPDDDHFVGRNM
jgi:hypothetical protein